MPETPKYLGQVKVLCGFRGVDTLTAMVFLTELGDLSRFPRPQQLMAYLGLVPSVQQSGGSGNRATGITKSGNARVRHVMTQSAWKYASRAVVTRRLRVKQKELPAWAVEQAMKAQKRLHASRRACPGLQAAGYVSGQTMPDNLVVLTWGMLDAVKKCANIEPTFDKHFHPGGLSTETDLSRAKPGR